MSKEEFACSRLVAVGSAQYHLHPEVLEAGTSFSTTVIRRPVHDNDHLLTPLDSVRLRQATSQLGQEQLHDVLVRVALRQGQPDLSLR